MDFLNQAVSQIRELMLSMTPAARVTALLLVSVIGVSLGYLFQQHSAGPDDYLFNGEFLPSRDVDRAEAAIAQAKLSGYERVGNRIKVPREKKAAYLAAVADAGALPPNFHTILEDALDLGPFVDRVTRQRRIDAAREQQLSMMIREMDGIEDAKVMYDVRRQQGLSKAREVTATVTVRPAPGEGISPRRLKMIKKAVAGAIAGLNPSDVTVANVGDGSTYGGGTDDASAELMEGTYYSTRIAYERLMKSNIENLLHNIPGVRVQVTAELDEAIERTTRTTTPEGEATALRETQQDEDTETSELNNGGRPRLTAQGPGRSSDQAAEATVKNKKTKGSRQTENFVGTKEQLLKESGLVPQHVRAAIAIPSNYLVSVWRERQRKKGEDPKQPLPKDIDTTLQGIQKEVEQNIEHVVVPLLPKEVGENPFSDVKITFFESLTPDPMQEPSTTDQALRWAGQNFNTLTMAFLAMVSLVMLRSMVKSIPSSAPSAPLGEATLSFDLDPSESQEANGEQDAGDNNRPRLRLNKGPSLKDDLTEMVREDPDAAAAILRTWIGNAG